MIRDLPAGLALLQEIYYNKSPVKKHVTPTTCVNEDRRYCSIWANGQLSVITGMSKKKHGIACHDRSVIATEV